MSRTGIGAAYVQKQLAAGKSLGQIQAQAAANGWQVGAAAQQMFSGGGGGGSPAPAAAPAPAPAQRTGIGATYVQQQLNQGRSIQDIQAEAQRNGYQIGAAAQQMFNNAAAAKNDYSVNRGTPASGRFFNPANFTGDKADSLGSGGFGAEALARARAAGYTDAQIRTTLAGSGVTIGDKAADQLGVMSGQTFFTGEDGSRRPENVRQSYSGQAGTRNTRPVLLPKGAYNYEANRPFEGNTVWAAGGANDADIANLYLRGEQKQGGEYGSYSEPDWGKYIGENGYLSATPKTDEKGNALPDPSFDPQKAYKDKFNSVVEAGGGEVVDEAPGTIASSAPQADTTVDEIIVNQRDLVDDVTGQSDVEPIKTEANELKQLESNRGYLTSGTIRKYYSSRFN